MKKTRIYIFMGVAALFQGCKEKAVYHSGMDTVRLLSVADSIISRRENSDDAYNELGAVYDMAAKKGSKTAAQNAVMLRVIRKGGCDAEKAHAAFVVYQKIAKDGVSDYAAVQNAYLLKCKGP